MWPSSPAHMHTTPTPSLVPRPHPPREEKGLVTIWHPARPSDISRLACEMTNHSTVRVISPQCGPTWHNNTPYVSTWSLTLWYLVTPLYGWAGCHIVTRPLFFFSPWGWGLGTRLPLPQAHISLQYSHVIVMWPSSPAHMHTTPTPSSHEPTV